MMLRAIALGLLLSAICIGCGSNRLTADNYRAIRGGMSMKEVESLFGKPYMVNQYRGETQWYYKNGSATAAVTFRRDRVIHKGETGLGVGDKEY